MAYLARHHVATDEVSIVHGLLPRGRCHALPLGLHRETSLVAATFQASLVDGLNIDSPQVPEIRPRSSTRLGPTVLGAGGALRAPESLACTPASGTVSTRAGRLSQCSNMIPEDTDPRCRVGRIVVSVSTRISLNVHRPQLCFGRRCFGRFPRLIRDVWCARSGNCQPVFLPHSRKLRNALS